MVHGVGEGGPEAVVDSVTPSRTVGPGPKSGYRERNTSADRVLDVLLLFGESRLTLSAAEVARELGAGRSTAYRYLQSLMAAGFIEETPDQRRFQLSARVLELARLAGRGLHLVDLAKPAMRTLCKQTGETVLLARRSGSWSLCLALEEPDQLVRMSHELGDLLPLNAGAPALVLLAWAPPDQIEQVITGGLQGFTDTTVTDPAALRERLAVIRSHGFAISRGEFEPGILGVGAPIRDATGQVAAALSVAGLVRRIPDERVPLLVNQVGATAQVSEQLELTT